MIVCLAMMAKAPPEVVLRAIDSARDFAQKICLVVAPGDPLTKLRLPVLDLQVERPNRIVEQPWLGHATTRTLTLRIAEQDPAVDWVLMIDAYSKLSGELPPLHDHEVDAYDIAIEDVSGAWRWMRPGHLMRARRGFGWEGALHEAMVYPPGTVTKPWRGLLLRGTASAGQARDFNEDARILRDHLDRHPDDARTAFYYAQSLKDAGRAREAFDAFTARARMAGAWSEETFWALLWRAKLAEQLDEDVVALHLECHRHSPERAEPLHGLEGYFRRQGRQDLAFLYGTKAASKPYPLDARLFVDRTAYSIEALQAAGIAA